jgi:hypothetical protein
MLSVEESFEDIERPVTLSYIAEKFKCLKLLEPD